MASVLLMLENLGEDKHVESVWLPRLDEGSTPSSSTMKKTDREMSISLLSLFCFQQVTNRKRRSGLTLGFSGFGWLHLLSAASSQLSVFQSYCATFRYLAFYFYLSSKKKNSPLLYSHVTYLYLINYTYSP